MSPLRNTITTAAALLLVASVAGAQETRRRESIPRDQLPPAGMCRVWIDGLAVTRQPAATDCATARRNAPINSRVVYGGSSNGLIIGNPRTIDPRIDPRDDPRRDRNGRELTKEERKRAKEWQKAQRKREKELEKIQREGNKSWEKSRRHRDHDGDDDDDDRNDDRRNRTVDDRRPRDDGRFTQVPRIFRP